jgi:hypothetical protein
MLLFSVFMGQPLLQMPMTVPSGNSFRGYRVPCDYLHEGFSRNPRQLLAILWKNSWSTTPFQSAVSTLLKMAREDWVHAQEHCFYSPNMFMRLKASLFLIPQETCKNERFKHQLQFLCQTRTTGVADVVYVNIVTWTVGCERVGGLAKGGVVVGRPETRVDGYSSPRAKKLVLQVSKYGVVVSKGLGWTRHEITCRYCTLIYNL